MNTSIIFANANPSNFASLGDQVEIHAKQDGEALRRFYMRAYNGGPMNVGFGRMVIVDLAGMKKAGGKRPILKNHNMDKVVGHTTSVKILRGDKWGVDIDGVISGASRDAREVVESSDNGFPWRASIGASVVKMVELDEGEKAEVNGRTVTGPMFIARKTILNEASFVPLAADDSTVTKMVASGKNSSVEVYTMNFEAWLKEKGLVLADLSEEQIEALKVEFEAEKDNVNAGEGEQTTPPAPPLTAAAQTSVPNPDEEIERLRAAYAAEADRVAQINAVAEGHPEIAAQAIKEGWSSEKTELTILRAERPQVPQIGAPVESTREALQAGFLMSLGIPEAELGLSEQAINAGQEFRSISLPRLFEECIRLSGQTPPRSFGSEAIKAGFSTVDLPVLLTEGTTRTLVRSFLGVKRTARRVAKVVPVSDFKEHTRYRLTDAGIFEKVGADGELKSGDLGEDTYTQKADTYGRMMTLTRQDIINDDLGAFLQIPEMLGRQAALAEEKTLFDLILANTGSYFSAGNNNYFDGADSALSVDSLTEAEQMFLEQVDDDDRPTVIMPSILLVPPALYALALRLMSSDKLIIRGDSDNLEPEDNPHAGKWSVEQSPYLASSISAAGSDTAWYMLASPADVSCFEIAHLRGASQPTIERVDLPANVLGMGWRAYFDFGVNQANHEAGVKSKGAA